mmetsp:Transcript_60411/g.141240  ORF Transcript_60411/g.141240 Transcript_60411/m.141240 type:complete len:765 (+) Transcript_60411:70-2364(+)
MQAAGVMPPSAGFPNSGQPAFRVMRPRTAGPGVQEARTNMTQLHSQMSQAQKEEFPLPHMPDGATSPPGPKPATFPMRPRSPRNSRPTTPTGCRTPTGPAAPPGAPPGMPGQVPMGLPPALPPTDTMPGARTPPRTGPRASLSGPNYGPGTGARTPVGGFQEAAGFRTPVGGFQDSGMGARMPMGGFHEPGQPGPGARTPVGGLTNEGHRNSIAIQPGTPCRVLTPRGGSTPVTGAGPGTAPCGTTPGRYCGGSMTPRQRPGSATPRGRPGGVTPPIQPGRSNYEYGAQAEDDGIIVDGRWAQPQGGQMQMQVPDAFFVAEPAMPMGPKALPWLPSRRPGSDDFKMLEKDDFLNKLNEVCDAFQPDDLPVVISGLGFSPMSESSASPQSQNQFKLAVAQGSLSTLVEEAMWSGPIRHMAICVMARRVIMLADAIRTNTETPGGKDLMVALLSAVKQMCAANTNDVTISKTDRFSGRIVLLLGSASCLPEQLLKQCEERYRQVDQHCMILALSMGAEPAGSAQLGRAMAIAVNAWGDAEEKYGPPGTAGGAGRPELLIHLFGSAGFHAWAKLLRLWYEQSFYPDQKRLRGRVQNMEKLLKGVILDSAPGDSGNRMLGAFPLVQGDAALLSAMNGYGADGTEQSEVEKLQASQSSMRELTKKNGPLWDYYEDLMRQEQGLPMLVHQHEPCVPLLFAYSASDRIAPAVQIERYIEECRMRLSQLGSQAQGPRQLFFESSGHVAHRSGATAEEYWRTVHDFWRQALFC